MAKIIKQFRYYGDNSDLNFPKVFNSRLVTFNNYITGDIFTYPIYQLGIQSVPGTKFYLNESLESVMIGLTGIYELDYNLNNKITKLQFDPKSMEAIRNNDNAYLIVDVFYDDKTIEEV